MGSDGSHRPAQRLLAAGLAGSALFALYGSLIPFRPQPLPFWDAVAAYRTLWANGIVIASRADLLANTLIGVPIGFCLMGLLRLRTRGLGHLVVSAAITCAAGAAFSLTLEFLQLFFRGRVVSTSDVVAQIAGLILGLTAWTMVSPVVRAALAPEGRRRWPALTTIELWLVGYAAVWMLLAVLPLDVTIRPGELLRKFRQGQIVLIPFSAHHATGLELAWDLASTVLMALPLGVLVRRLARHAQLSIGASLAVGGLFVLAMEFVQVFVLTRVADVTDVLLAGTGLGLGVALARRWDGVAGDDDAASTSGRAIGSLVAACVAWCGVLVFYHWRPFEFDVDPGHLRARMAAVSMLPFAQYQHADALAILSDVLLKGALAMPLGVLAGRVIARATAHPALATLWTLASVAGCTVVLAGIEAGQLFLPARVADPTDVLIGVASAALGVKLAARPSAPLAFDRTSTTVI